MSLISDPRPGGNCILLPGRLRVLRSLFVSQLSSEIFNAIHTSVGDRWGKRVSEQPSAPAGTLSTDQKGRVAFSAPSESEQHHLRHKRPLLSTAQRTRSSDSVEYQQGIFGSRNGGISRGRRIAASYRQVNLATAVEVLRKSPLPEQAVWRKMRQIVGARLGWTALKTDAGGTGSNASVARRLSRSRSGSRRPSVGIDFRSTKSSATFDERAVPGKTSKRVHSL